MAVAQLGRGQGGLRIENPAEDLGALWACSDSGGGGGGGSPMHVSHARTTTPTHSHTTY